MMAEADSERAELDRGRYLARIGCVGSIEPVLETLRRLHRQHLLHVPFENLDIHLGRPLSLEPEALFDKIVRRRRGGFCYELNGLFAWLLRDLGFEVTMLAGRFLDDGGRLGPEFDHMALLVLLERRWLADVGFGENFLEPVALDSDEPHFEGDVGYRIVRWNRSYSALERRGPGGEWERQYLFDAAPHRIEEYETRCHYHQTSPESHFTQKRLCTLATPEGRVTLSELTLLERTGSLSRETKLAGEAEWRVTLKERFGVELGPGEPAGRRRGAGASG